MVFDGGVGLKLLRVATRPAFLALALSAVVLPAPALTASRAPARPVVVELFTAQGCSACIQANKTLADVASDKAVIGLTYSVDYLDYLGWKDTFAMPEFTARQRAYVGRLKLREIYSPELVVDGKAEVDAGDRDKLNGLIKAEGEARTPAPSIVFARKGEKVTVGPGAVPRGGAEVWLVFYDPMRRDVRVRTGENAGKTVTHVNVVRSLTRLGPWMGRTRTYDIPADAAASPYKPVAILQGKDGGPILAAARN